MKQFSFITRLTGILLVTGFFYSCSITSQVSLNDLIESQNYQQALTAIDEQLEENPSQPDLYINKAKINAALARDTEPELRTDFYINTVNNFELAIDYNANQEQLEIIDSLKQQYWKGEHNSGLAITENQVLTDRFQRAKTHFENALIIRPNALSSLRNLSVVQFNLGEIDGAITNLETLLELTSEPNAELFENIGFLYLQKGNAEQAVHYYELANSSVGGDDLNLAYGLVNAYITKGDHEKAISLLEELVEQYPNNANLRNVYGTQLYQITSEIMEDLGEAYAASDTVIARQIRVEAEGMGDEAESQLIEAYKRDTTNIDFLESLAVFYNNLSAQYISVSQNAFESDRADLSEKAGILINFAIDYYEKLLELSPSNQEYNNRLNTLNQLKENFTASTDY
jgi:tetratricopeptide (TPR) repeat protein